MTFTEAILVYSLFLAALSSSLSIFKARQWKSRAEHWRSEYQRMLRENERLKDEILTADALIEDEKWNSLDPYNSSTSWASRQTVVTGEREDD